MGGNKTLQGTTGSFTDVDATAQNPLGLIVPDEFGNEYIYVKGVASAAAGDWGVINSDYSTARTLSTPLTGRVGVYLAALIANTFGWMQITGLVSTGAAGNGVTAANIATASTDKLPLFMSATAGRASSSLLAGCAILGAWGSGSATSNVGNAWINRPFAPGFTLASA